MNAITIEFSLLSKYKININQYLILYSLANPGNIDGILQYNSRELVELERLGWIKILNNNIILRQITKDVFFAKKDYFLTWLSDYPIKVNKKHGGTRHLSPADDNTILGKKLRIKWESMFKGKPIDNQMEAIEVLNAQVKMMKDSGDLEYMVEATKWLNQGYHEQYAYLLTEEKGETFNGAHTNYEEDWNY